MGVAELSEGEDWRRRIGGLRVRSGFGFGRISGDRLGFGFRSLLGRRRNPKLRLGMIGATIGVSRGSGGDVGGIGVGVGFHFAGKERKPPEEGKSSRFFLLGGKCFPAKRNHGFIYILVFWYFR